MNFTWPHPPPSDGRAPQILRDVCTKSPSLATRLRRLAHAGHLPNVTAPALKDALKNHGWKRNRLGAGSRVQLADKEDVTLFLELVEGLYYEADFSGQRRRADRFSVRA